MELFEYLVVMVSIVLGLGVTQALRGLGKISRSPRPFLPVTIWTILLFYLHVQVWWGMWDLVGVASWNQFSFYLVIAIPCSLFAAVELLVPLSSGDDTDWEAHYFTVRNLFLGMICTISILAMMTTYYLIDVPLIHPYRIVQLTMTVTVILGFFTRSRNAHIWISSVYLGVLLVGQILFRFAPGLNS